jgi:hypothetical protein
MPNLVPDLIGKTFRHRRRWERAAPKLFGSLLFDVGGWTVNGFHWNICFKIRSAM